MSKLKILDDIRFVNEVDSEELKNQREERDRYEFNKFKENNDRIAKKEAESKRKDKEYEEKRKQIERNKEMERRKQRRDYLNNNESSSLLCLNSIILK